MAGNLSAKPALRDQPQITEALISVGIAYEISQVCGEIDARILRGIGVLNGLKSTARQLGYTEAEIDAFTDSRTEQDRLEGIARARLEAMGARPGDAASHCAVGRAEMAKGSAIGRLLR